MSVAKRCGCGATFTRRAWDRLPSLGTTEVPGGKYRLDFRDCPGCGSTMALPKRIPGTKPEELRAA